ncbi:lytic polysaccharide monooxygenase [Aaosphaeria arxii CBS 175.79]|uniref:AA9 family lytic polysaccharide monooxygenase n=1 Tax=Aaosphaeria arxii CBS 175.79 TaxID=1450172 RepID=A0A6A5XG25_9PLEO|nr:lytic polysaccharide monooxygenase [Aaosphaeria arxii CBS 175.79]KAF2012118.1 lytic polysaccharide monooxygenase [Aaosphaeria arxii CBS 175.79]
MKTFAAATLLLATLAEVAQGHYIFQYLTANGAKGAKYQNVRTNSNYNSPVTSLSSNDLRCNVGASSGGGNTTTVSVAAGSSVSFTADTAVYHQGPVSFYMTKVSDAVAADGSTDWFKIKEIGPSFSGGQAKWDMSLTYSVQLPSCISAGDYLLRIEQLGIHNPGSPPQFYVACAQVKVTGGGSGSPKPTVKIPGHVKSSDPGYTANIYNNFNSYIVPGPKVATC